MPIAPLAWLASRPFARDLREIAAGGHRLQAVEDATRRWFAAHGFQVPASNLDPSTADIDIVSAVVSARLFDAHGRDMDRDSNPEAQAIMAKSVTQMMQAGNQVFDISPALVEELANTDVDDVRASDIQMPYGCIYVRMPRAIPDVRLPGTDTMVPVDGVIISTDLDAKGEIMLGVEIMPSPGTDVDAALMPTAAIPWDRAATLPEVVRQLAIEIEARYLDEEAIASIEKSAASSRHPRAYQDNSLLNQERFEQGMRDVATFLPLLANVLLFIDNCRAEDPAWPADAPADLVAKANLGSTGSRKAEQALTRLGWTRTRRCALEDERGQTRHSGVKTHWRRGHWRRQPHGPGAKLRKLVRVRPTLVNAAHGEPAETRVYKTPDHS